MEGRGPRLQAGVSRHPRAEVGVPGRPKWQGCWGVRSPGWPEARPVLEFRRFERSDEKNHTVSLAAGAWEAARAHCLEAQAFQRSPPTRGFKKEMDSPEKDI